MQKKLFPLLFLILAAGCSSSTDIIPNADLTTDPDDLRLSNPISIVADAANDQIIVVNSNVDVNFDQGTIVIFNIDATDPDNPILTPTDILGTPNYAGQTVFDGVNLYVPFREAVETSGDEDQVRRYTIGADSIEEDLAGTTLKNPFGIAFHGTDILIVNDEELDILDADLVREASVDLTSASDDANIDDSRSRRAESVAVDPATGLAFITNPTGKVFVVDLNTNELTHVIDGPENSRGIAFDGTFFYVVDGKEPGLWVFDPSLLPAPTSPPEEIDDGVLAVDIIPLGRTPYGIALDLVANRAYVTNASERSVSVIDLVLREELTRISLKNDDTVFDEGKLPIAVAAGTYDGTPLVFVGNFDSDSVSVINADTLQVVAAFPD